MRPIRWSLLLGVVAPLLMGGGCSFDKSGAGPSDSRFAGTWRGSSAAGRRILLQLEGSALLSGTLVIGEREELIAYALEGEVETTGFAEMTGTNVAQSAEQETVTAFLPSDDSLIVRVGDGPPSDPLEKLGPTASRPDTLVARWGRKGTR